MTQESKNLELISKLEFLSTDAEFNALKEKVSHLHADKLFDIATAHLDRKNFINVVVEYGLDIDDMVIALQEIGYTKEEITEHLFFDMSRKGQKEMLIGEEYADTIDFMEWNNEDPREVLSKLIEVIDDTDDVVEVLRNNGFDI